MLSAVVAPVVISRCPIVTQSFLGFAAFQPVKSEIHGFTFLCDDSAIDDAFGCCVISLDRSDWLVPSHFGEGKSDGESLFHRNIEGTQFRFRCRRHDKFDDLGDGKDWSIPSRLQVIF